MKKRLLLLPAGGAVLALFLPVLGCAGDDAPAAKRTESPGDAAISKSVVEGPIKNALKRSQPAPALDERPISFAASKGGVEMPIKKALKRSAAAPTAAPVYFKPTRLPKDFAFSKMRVEGPLKKALERPLESGRIVRKAADPPLATGVGKRLIEGPLLRSLGRDARVVKLGNGRTVTLGDGVTFQVQDPREREVEAPVKRGLQQRKKEAVERPVKRALATGQSKRKVEAPIKRAIRRPAPRIAARRTPLPRPGERVKPGLVTWHASYEAALAAGKRSGKPVMLLHTLGRLDDRFC